MDFETFYTEIGDLTINDEDTMYEVGSDMLKHHLHQKNVIFDVKNTLGEIKAQTACYDGLDYDCSLLALAEIYAALHTYKKLVNYASEESDTYIEAEQLQFDLEGKAYLLTELKKLREAPADERVIYVEFNMSDEEKDPFFLEVLDMYIDLLASGMTK